MKLKLVFIALIVLFKPITGFTQDTIYRLNGDTIYAKVIAINPEDIKYKRNIGTLEPTYTILRSTVKSISFNDGSSIIIDGKQGEEVKVVGVVDTSEALIIAESAQPEPEPERIQPASIPKRVSKAESADSSGLSYKEGQQDAKKHYKKTKLAATVTASISLVSPLAGLVSALVCSFRTPSDKNLGYPDEKKMHNNKAYAKGYTKEAIKIKQNKVWIGWAIGLGVNYAIATLLSF